MGTREGFLKRILGLYRLNDRLQSATAIKPTDRPTICICHVLLGQLGKRIKRKISCTNFTYLKGKTGTFLLPLLRHVLLILRLWRPQRQKTFFSPLRSKFHISPVKTIPRRKFFFFDGCKGSKRIKIRCKAINGASYHFIRNEKKEVSFVGSFSIVNVLPTWPTTIGILRVVSAKNKRRQKGLVWVFCRLARARSRIPSQKPETMKKPTISWPDNPTTISKRTDQRINESMSTRVTAKRAMNR